MMIPGVRSLIITHRLFAGMLAAAAFSLMVAGDAFAVLRHQYNFNSGDGTSAVDSVAGGVNGTLIGTGATIDTTDHRLVLNGTDRYVDIPGASLAINTYANVSIEAWVMVDPKHNGQYTASIGFGDTDGSGNGQQYILMQPTRGGPDGDSGQITPTSAGGEVRVNTQKDLSDMHLHQTVLTISGTQLAYYLDGVQVGATATLPAGTDLSHVSNNHAYLGKSVWSGDPLLTGALYKVSIYDDIKSPADVATLYSGGNGCGSCGNLSLSINRDTGLATLKNTLSIKKLVGYTLNSTKGAITTANWNSIADHGDQDSGGSVDPSNTWSTVVTTKQQLNEMENAGGPNPGAPFQNNGTISLGNIWTKSPFEDYNANITYLDQNFNLVTVSTQVDFTGHGGVSYTRSDLNLDGVIDGSDYMILKQHHLQTLAGTLPIDTFALGDLNGDLKNDYLDFRLFKADYVAAHGAAGFASMVAIEGGYVPEPATFGLAILGAAAVVLASQRKRARSELQTCLDVTRCFFSKRHCTMNRVSRFFALIAFLLLIPSVSNAQTVVSSQNFDGLPTGDLNASGLAGERYFVCCNGVNPTAVVSSPGAGGSGNAVRAGADQVPGGFSLGGFGFDMPVVGNVSSTPGDYILEWDMRIVSGVPINGAGSGLSMFITMVDAPVFGGATANGSVYDATNSGVSALTVGGPYGHVSMGLGTPAGLFFNRPVNWDPGNATNSYEFNVQGNPTGGTVTEVYEVDNVKLTLNIATSLGLLVDPATGKARIKNLSANPIQMDYYSIESTNNSLLTANFNGTTGWKSLHDQGLDSQGAGVGQSWDEVDTNSAARLVEEFLLGNTTLAPGQSVGLGAPINPAILASQASTLKFRFGGPNNASLGIGTVAFQSLVLTGDYNDNGVVDAADYTVWRDHLGQTFALPNRDPLNSGAISAADYASWKTHFGATFGAGSGAAAAVPEPPTALLGLLAVCLVGASARLRPRTDVQV